MKIETLKQKADKLLELGDRLNREGKAVDSKRALRKCRRLRRKIIELKR